jgi:hypothetical protein
MGSVVDLAEALETSPSKASTGLARRADHTEAIEYFVGRVVDEGEMGGDK